MNSKIRLLFVITVVFSIFSAFNVFAASPAYPNAPDTISTESSTRFPQPENPVILEAEAGNVTELIFTSQRSTMAWQGYYGNITGTIVLADANNNSMYSWAIAQAQGQIFAANTSGIDWPSVRCVNYSASNDVTVSGQTLNLTTLEDSFGINLSDKDGFNETFNNTYTCGGADPCFRIATRMIRSGECPMVTTYVDGISQPTSFREVLMNDNNTGAVLFVALLEPHIDGFKTGVDQHDFQMVVAENGHAGFEESTTTYYFYVQLS